ncbi:MAG: nucleotidyltransferase family protein [Rhodoblastus sp.]|nr:MAG: nucleotidyltransferase family protein [Rhodoblastus sp.]
MDLLRALRATDRRLHLGAGLIRSTIWDRLHRRPAAASGGDADVVYFDPARASPRHDADIDARLRRLRPSIPWETTNQARMRDPNEGLRDDWSLAHAVAGWPETCTAIAVRLRDDDRLEFVAPWGSTTCST